MSKGLLFRLHIQVGHMQIGESICGVVLGFVHAKTFIQRRTQSILQIQVNIVPSATLGDYVHMNVGIHT